MRIEPEFGGCSIVLVGSFNPAIFSPDWFARHEVVGASEADEAEVKVIHPDISNFSLGGKGILVEQNRFVADTAEAPWIRLADLVVKTFGEILVHTPVTKLGVNRMVHFGVGSEEIRNRIGRRLAPTEPWGEWGAVIEESPPELRAGFVSLTMQESWKADGYACRVQAKVEPSLRMAGNAGVYVNVNTHFELEEKKSAEGSERILTLLNDRFDESVKRAEWIIDQVMRLKDEVN